MTKAATKVADVFFPGAGTAAREGQEAAQKILTPEVGESKDLPTRGGPADPEIEKRVTEQFATRKQAIGAAAVAAGATRSENEADLLGYATPKRRGASRTLLGGR